MKPEAFEYHQPSTVEEAARLLEELTEAELLAGNQSLGIIMANRLAGPDNLIDLGEVDELNFVEVDGDDVEVGAMATHATIEHSAELKDRVPILPEAAEQIAGPSVRNLGTMGGSVVEADPAGNYPTVLVAFDASFHFTSVDGDRTVSARDFYIAYMFTDRRENEILRSVTIPLAEFPIDRTGMAFLEQKRTAQTFPTVSAASVVRVDDPDADEPVVEEARVALGNASDIPLRVEEAETALEGEPLSEDTLDDAAAAAIEAADPTEEMHTDTEFKGELVGEYTRRSLETSYDRVTSHQ